MTAAFPKRTPPFLNAPDRVDTSDHVSMVHGFAFPLLCLFLFIYFSRVFDVVGEAFKIPYALQLLVIVMTFAAGHGFTWFGTKVGKYLLWFLLWAVVTVPFAYWKAATLDALIDMLRSFIL